MAGATLSNGGGVNTTAYSAYDDGDPGNDQHGGRGSLPWHRRMSPELWLWLIVVGAFAGLWAIAGGFRKVLS